MDPAHQFDGDVGRAGHAARSDVSLALSATASSEWYSVGGPGSIVMRSRSISSTTASTSNTATGSIVAPRRKRRDQAGLQPEGVEVRVDHQVAVALAQIRERRPLLVHPQRLRWFIMAPLGLPVVPEV